MAKTLLVLGNGFDLSAGLKSSFSQYLSSDYYKSKIQIVSEIYELANIRLRTIYTSSPTHVIPSEMQKLFEKVTFWDLYYALPHTRGFGNVELWYDFESQLQCFVSSAEQNYGDYKEIVSTSCEEAQIRIKNENEEKTVYDLILKLYLSFYQKEQKNYYDTLFKDLKEYEIQFGKYIEMLQNEEKSYGEKAEGLIQKLTGKDTLVYLNTFNYSDLTKYVPAECDIWHVNGDIEHPIFGIDYSGSSPANSRWFSFSKTYRRLELEGNIHYFPKNKDFTKVIVFGHSLNRQDYNYFYALFNRLNLSNDRGKRNGYTVEFVYSGYKGKSPDEARHETMGRVLRLLQGYNRDVLHEENFRLMDILFCNGAVKFRELK